MWVASISVLRLLGSGVGSGSEEGSAVAKVSVVVTVELDEVVVGLNEYTSNRMRFLSVRLTIVRFLRRGL